MFYLFLDLLKLQTTEEYFSEILAMADDDIKFNRTNFGKTTNIKEYIRICVSCTRTFSRVVSVNMTNILESLDRIVNATLERGAKGTNEKIGQIIEEEIRKVKEQEVNYEKHIN